MNTHSVYDRIYGPIELPVVVAEMMATSEFSRLDGVRQLGGCAFVYPSATHTRREHSIGVAYLAGRMGRHLQELRPDMVHDDDIMCLQLAGLVHDLGHGPFSHVFEDYVRTRRGIPWSHESMGLRVFDHIIARYPHIRESLGPHSAQHVAFVHLLVRGLPHSAPWPDAAAIGRDPYKRFLLDVVHNAESGLDVDKLDYLARDALAVFGASRTFDVERLVNAARLLRRGDRWTVAYDESVARNVADVFSLRAHMHQRVYQHRAVVVVEALLLDLMYQLDECLSEEERLYNAIENPARFCTLTDATILNRSYASDAELAGARSSWRALYVRPWLARVPSMVRLRTVPACSVCKTDTAFEDHFCSACGSSTRDRRAVAMNGISFPPECLLTSEEATSILCNILRRSDVRILITDVCCGAAIDVHDPHGVVWRDYDPLHNLVFCHRNGASQRASSASCHVPKVRRVRMAYCYLPVGSRLEALDAAQHAFEEWGETVGSVEVG